MQWLPHFGRRLEELRRRAGVKQDDVCEHARISRSSWSRLIRGARVPDSDAEYRLILEAIRATDAEVREESSAIVEVPVYDIEVAAGSGRFLSEEAAIGTWPFPREWIERMFGRDAELAIVKVVGDSQEPELRSGDSLMIDLRRRSGSDGMHVVRVDDALLVKRVQAEGGAMRLGSYNPAYADIVIPREEADARLAVIGRAVWAGKTL